MVCIGDNVMSDDLDIQGILDARESPAISVKRYNPVASTCTVLVSRWWCWLLAGTGAMADMLPYVHALVKLLYAT